MSNPQRRLGRARAIAPALACAMLAIALAGCGPVAIGTGIIKGTERDDPFVAVQADITSDPPTSRAPGQDGSTRLSFKVAQSQGRKILAQLQYPVAGTERFQRIGAKFVKLWRGQARVFADATGDGSVFTAELGGDAHYWLLEPGTYTFEWDHERQTGQREVPLVEIRLVHEDESYSGEAAKLNVDKLFPKNRARESIGRENGRFEVPPTVTRAGIDADSDIVVTTRIFDNGCDQKLIEKGLRVEWSLRGGPWTKAIDPAAITGKTTVDVRDQLDHGCRYAVRVAFAPLEEGGLPLEFLELLRIRLTLSESFDASSRAPRDDPQQLAAEISDPSPAVSVFPIQPPVVEQVRLPEDPERVRNRTTVITRLTNPSRHPITVRYDADFTYRSRVEARESGPALLRGADQISLAPRQTRTMRFAWDAVGDLGIGATISREVGARVFLTASASVLVEGVLPPRAIRSAATRSEVADVDTSPFLFSEGLIPLTGLDQAGVPRTATAVFFGRNPRGPVATSNPRAYQTRQMFWLRAADKPRSGFEVWVDQRSELLHDPALAPAPISTRVDALVPAFLGERHPTCVAVRGPSNATEVLFGSWNPEPSAPRFERAGTMNLSQLETLWETAPPFPFDLGGGAKGILVMAWAPPTRTATRSTLRVPIHLFAFVRGATGGWTAHPRKVLTRTVCLSKGDLFGGLRPYLLPGEFDGDPSTAEAVIAFPGTFPSSLPALEVVRPVRVGARFEIQTSETHPRLRIPAEPIRQKNSPDLLDHWKLLVRPGLASARGPSLLLARHFNREEEPYELLELDQTAAGGFSGQVWQPTGANPPRGFGRSLLEPLLLDSGGRRDVIYRFTDALLLLRTKPRTLRERWRPLVFPESVVGVEGLSDVNGDGDLDVIVRNDSGAFLYAPSLRSSFLQPFLQDPNKHRPCKVPACRDLNGDGTPDLVAAGFVTTRADDGSYTLDASNKLIESVPATLSRYRFEQVLDPFAERGTASAAPEIEILLSDRGALLQRTRVLTLENLGTPQVRPKAGSEIAVNLPTGQDTLRVMAFLPTGRLASDKTPKALAVILSNKTKVEQRLVRFDFDAEKGTYEVTKQLLPNTDVDLLAVVRDGDLVRAGTDPARNRIPQDLFVAKRDASPPSVWWLNGRRGYAAQEIKLNRPKERVFEIAAGSISEDADSFEDLAVLTVDDSSGAVIVRVYRLDQRRGAGQQRFPAEFPPAPSLRLWAGLRATATTNAPNEPLAFTFDRTAVRGAPGAIVFHQEIISILAPATAGAAIRINRSPSLGNILPTEGRVVAHDLDGNGAVDFLLGQLRAFDAKLLRVVR